MILAPSPLLYSNTLDFHCISHLGSLCDPMESFNSKNEDIFSNMLLSGYAEYHIHDFRKWAVMFILQYVDTMERENKIDSVRDDMLNGRDPKAANSGNKYPPVLGYYLARSIELQTSI